MCKTPALTLILDFVTGFLLPGVWPWHCRCNDISGCAHCHASGRPNQVLQLRTGYRKGKPLILCCEVEMLTGMFVQIKPL